MPPALPLSYCPLLVRTDFTDRAGWEAVRDAALAPSVPDEFRANLEVVDDPAYDGLTARELIDLQPQASDIQQQVLGFAVDAQTLAHPDHPILVIGWWGDTRGRQFRVIPNEMWSVENNLSQANIDFDEFAGHVDPEGIFRGF
jgi:hypothetical protein